jgi:hypothetical protein
MISIEHLPCAILPEHEFILSENHILSSDYVIFFTFSELNM